jgi:transaldolase
MLVRDKPAILMNLQSVGQSLWLDHAARAILREGSFIQMIEDWSLTGALVSPAAICQALKSSSAYDIAVAKKIKEGLCGEQLLQELILEDTRYGADLFRHVFDKTDGVDGWVVMPVSPLKGSSVEEFDIYVRDLHARIKRANVLITVPGLQEYSELIPNLLFDGIPVNISLIGSQAQYISAAEAYLRGIGKRISSSLNPAVSAFISVPVSRMVEMFSADNDEEKALELAITMARRIYRAMRTLHTSREWERAYNGGARLLKLVWMNGVSDQSTRIQSNIPNHLVAPLTVTTMSKLQLDDSIYGRRTFELLPEQANDHAGVLHKTPHEQIVDESIGTQLQESMVEHQVKTWITLLDELARKSASIVQKPF